MGFGGPRSCCSGPWRCWWVGGSDLDPNLNYYTREVGDGHQPATARQTRPWLGHVRLSELNVMPLLLEEGILCLKYPKKLILILLKLLLYCSSKIIKNDELQELSCLSKEFCCEAKADVKTKSTLSRLDTIGDMLHVIFRGGQNHVKYYSIIKNGELQELMIVQEQPSLLTEC
ncbi:hypothetical protein VPH35_098347 [Triticum aestivum]|uniref:Uncharacterized protein n=1 Tax=Aegilops tauschii TaxID=37682 RepID=N1R4B6_AEGTA